MFGVFTFTLTNFLAKIFFFQRVSRVYKRVSRNSRGIVGDYLSGQIIKVLGSGEGEGGRDYAKFFPWWGVDIIKTNLSKVTVNHKT